MNNKIDKGVHYLEIVHDLEDKETDQPMTELDIKEAEEQMSKELGGVPVVFVGVIYE